MARRASAEIKESSLELLLDTICNTFGGVLFIAILVIVLVNMSSREIPRISQENRAELDLELLQLQQDLERSRERLETLTATTSRLKAIKDRFTSQESVRLSQEVRQTKLDVSQTVLSNSRGGEETAVMQQDINQLSDQLEQQQDDLKNARTELQNLSVKLQGVVQKNARESQLPTALKKTGSPDANFILKQGVLCDLGHPAESRSSEENGIRFLDPVLSAGLKIPAENPDPQLVAARFDARGIPGRHLIRIWVSPDSHAQWDLVRETLVKRGNQYELVLLPEGERLAYGATSRVMRSQ